MGTVAVKAKIEHTSQRQMIKNGNYEGENGAQKNSAAMKKKMGTLAVKEKTEHVSENSTRIANEGHMNKEIQDKIMKRNLFIS